MQEIWEAGGKPDTVYLGAAQMNVAVGFTGNNNQRSTVVATNKTTVKALDVYVTQWGTVTFTPSRLCRSRDLFIVQSDKWAVANFRPTFREALAKSGDSRKGQVITELTLEARNEKASGAVFDLS
jgi:hypothetical protein